MLDHHVSAVVIMLFLLMIIAILYFVSLVLTIREGRFREKCLADTEIFVRKDWHCCSEGVPDLNLDNFCDCTPADLGGGETNPYIKFINDSLDPNNENNAKNWTSQHGAYTDIFKNRS